MSSRPTRGEPYRRPPRTLPASRQKHRPDPAEEPERQQTHQDELQDRVVEEEGREEARIRPRRDRSVLRPGPVGVVRRIVKVPAEGLGEEEKHYDGDYRGHDESPAHRV